ncbi:D-Ala-D-Ala carboxypeptidase DacF. Serine peptidase. MEROPS family S11 [Amphibacillus marinus]|uniref:serine-type D-Ala-D-Ala carboxypeptidase n=1 Tax=Amphibacillus marinus TaxID=872970 RepID=A0A1H8GCF6_9BACI|nr:D-alanyl-D-alanine carboxypeptidase family protein [Amphibacillus marinus]SEN40988.1 D-Ala-D-Ala carboxypeptidase DacF. Serine peptidase. MEROPS family S11 [Amphibacillus marinus]
MKKTIILLMLLIFTTQPISAFAQETEYELDLDTKSVILIERNTGKVLYEENKDTTLPPASMTKMMTLLLIADAIEQQKISLADTVRISEFAASMGGSQIYLEPNEEMTVDELLKAVAVGSANDASVALAEHIYGSEKAFVEAMNNKVVELDLANTHFSNTTGLPEENHYSTAHDMAMIARALLAYPFITEYTSIYEDYLRKGTDNEFWLVNTNKLVKFYPGVDGLKTGFTQEAKYCLTATAQKNDMRLIAVVMGAESPKLRNSAITKLLDYGFSQFDHKKLYDRHQAVAEIDVLKGKAAKLAAITQDAVSIVTKKGTNLEQLELKTVVEDELVAPIEAGTELGKLEIHLDGELIDEIVLISEVAIEKASFWQLIKDSTNRLLRQGAH